MNITPRIKSTRNHKHLIVNVSIEIPLKNKYSHNSLSPSPNHRKKYKLTSTVNIDKKSTYQSNLNTLRDMPYTQSEMYPNYAPSRKKQTAPTPLPSQRGLITKFKSAQLSPKRKSTSRKSKPSQIVRNISILQQVVNDEDNIIKYTSQSNELREKVQTLLHSSQKVQTHVSEVDISEIRELQLQYKENKESQNHKIAIDLLKTACAKKIQRAWRKYRTKKLIRSYSNDIRKKNFKKIQNNEELAIKSARSQGASLKLKSKTQLEQQVQVQTERGRNKMTKFQEESIEKWQQMLEKIKNQKNIDKLLEISLERTQELKQDIEAEDQETADFFKDKETNNKIIKTKGYYEQERERKRQITERNGAAVKGDERVKYFENEMLRIENDLSDISSESRTNSLEGQGLREIQELQNLKLRKKLEIFKEHLPEIQHFPSDTQSESKQPSSNNKRIDIATIIKKKNEQINLSPPEQNLPEIPCIFRTEEKIDLIMKEQPKKSALTIIQQELSGIETHRQWSSSAEAQEEQQSAEWKNRLLNTLLTEEEPLLLKILEQLILESLIQISESEQLIRFIKNIYEQTQKKVKKPEGIVTSHASIKDYLNYFINYLYQHQMEPTLQQNLLRPIGPTALDVLKYFRGEDLPYDPDSEYVMNIKIFNEHWKYANEFIYFDPKWQDPQKESERVTYLKQLTKVFFRSIFDCFNQSLQYQRIYGMRGKPYPWSFQKLSLQVPNFKKSLLTSFQRVIKMSTVFCGVLFQDKQHSLDKRTMDQIQQQNTVKLILLQCQQDEQLWNFCQDELVEIKLQFAKYVEQRLIMEAVKIITMETLRK